MCFICFDFKHNYFYFNDDDNDGVWGNYSK